MITAMATTTTRQRRRFTTDDERWKSVRERDAGADGAFFYSVKTTGVYCRPGCPSRLARRENVRFHASREEAERAGFRACKRCRPGEPGIAEQRAAAVAKACRTIAASDAPVTLAALANEAGLSRHHFHRVFTALTGVTPKAYAARCRAERLRNGLLHASTVTEAIYDAGYGSSSRFYATSNAALGMSPTAVRARGAGETIRIGAARCKLGHVAVASSDKGICAILLGDQPEILMSDLRARYANAEISRDRAFTRALSKVVAFVDAPKTNLDLPLDVRGTAFQQRVWQALRAIPPGATASYKELAARVGAPKSVRAVAHACASNPIAVAIPCHRVVGSDGNLRGYRWGIERKRALLAGEGSGEDDR